MSEQVKRSHRSLLLFTFVFIAVIIGVDSSAFADLSDKCNRTTFCRGLQDQKKLREDPGAGNGHGERGAPAPAPPRVIDLWSRVEERKEGCREGAGGSTLCGAQRNTCESNGSQVEILATDVLSIVAVGGSTSAPEDGVNYSGTRRDTETGSESSLGYGCWAPEAMQALEPGAPPVAITMTVSDFAELPVVPMQANAGPEIGWIPVNMQVVLYVDGEDQVLETTLLDTPVSVRAVPIEYEWDMGDGNTITTSKPGAPYPSMEVAGVYRYEGWYDVTLTTTFAGQFSVDGGEWQDIDGTITIESEPVEIFSKSLESRLVNSDVPVDVDEDPWVPERSPETEGELDPEATHREI